MKTVEKSITFSRNLNEFIAFITLYFLIIKENNQR